MARLVRAARERDGARSRSPSGQLKGAFDRVVFAVYDRKGGEDRAAFDRVFA